MARSYKHIIISRTDSIGDVILTLPIAGLLKEVFPSSRISFLGRTYTRPIIDLSKNIDDFLNWDDFEDMDFSQQVKELKKTQADLIVHVFPVWRIACVAKKAGIKDRLGTTNRFFHWLNCNKLVAMSRRRSDLHEAQLNIKLIKSLTGIEELPLDKITGYLGLGSPAHLKDELSEMFDNSRFNLILHPKSKGSAREWGLENYKKLVKILPDDRFRIFITGTGEEGRLIHESGLFSDNPGLVDLTGRLTLPELISVINKADGLLAASTGPLHIAAALDKHALGIYPPIKPMHPGRWAPIGKNASWLVLDKSCNDCRKGKDCSCIREISPEQVRDHFTKIA